MNKFRRCVCVICAVLIFALSVLEISVYAEEDPVEPVATFYGYEIQGFDIDGNVVLSNNDYESYFNSRLSARTSAIATYGFSASVDLESTFFVELGDWLKFGSSASFSMLATANTGSQSVGFDKNIGTIAKKRIHYTTANVYEILTLSLNANMTTGKSSYTLTRSGFGASTTFTKASSGNTGNQLYFKAGGFDVELYGLEIGLDAANWAKFSVRAQSVNTLPTTETSATSLLDNNDNAVIGLSYPVEYAENTFFTNDYDYSASHILQVSSNNYFQPISVLSPIMNNITITPDNVNNFSLYGFYIDDLGNIDLDLNVLTDHIADILLPDLELQYQNFFNEFPLPGETAGSPDIEFTNPFEPETAESPPTSSGSGSGSFDFDYGEVISPSELQDILEQETYYLAELDTNRLDLQLDQIPELQNLPDEIISGVSGLGGFYESLLSASGVLPVFAVIAVVVFFIRAFKG